MNHDQCHNTVKYRWCGQNLAGYGTTASKIDIDSAIQSGIDRWWNEHKKAKQSDLDLFDGRYDFSS